MATLLLSVFNAASRAFHDLGEFPIAAADWAKRYDLYQPNGLTPLKAEEVPLYRALHGEEVRDVEMVIAPKGREPRRLLASGRPLIDKHGDNLGAVVAMRDITLTRKIEIALRESEEHWRAVIHTLREGIVEQDKRRSHRHDECGGRTPPGPERCAASGAQQSRSSLAYSA